MSYPVALAPFVEQTRGEHALAVLGGGILFVLTYFGAVWVAFGDPGSLQHGPDSATPRLFAGTIATACCWAYFGIAFIRGYGGPILNTVVYPVLVAAIAPVAARWVAFGPAIGEFGPRLLLPSASVLIEMALYAAVTVAAGIGAFTIVLLVWSSAFVSEDEQRAWERKHLDPAFRDAFVERE